MKLSPAQIQDYEREGYLFLPDLFSAEEITRLISKGKAKAAVSKAKLYHKHHGGL